MTANNFAASLKLVLVHEGLWSDHPDDPGKGTMKGVTQAVYDSFRRDADQPTRSVRRITNAELETIYRRKYWSLIHADAMPSGVDYMAFDYSVNSGPGRAVKDIQRALGCKVDGIIGPDTLAGIQAADDAKLISDVCARRLRFLKSLRTWGTFGRGWARRVAGVRDAALVMIAGDDLHFTSRVLPAPDAKGAVKAQEADQAQLKTADGAGISATTVGGLGQTAMERAQELQPHIGDSILGRLAIAVFVILMVSGLGFLAYSQITRIKEKGGLGGYIGSVFANRS